MTLGPSAYGLHQPVPSGPSLGKPLPERNDRALPGDEIAQAKSISPNHILFLFVHTWLG